jgi:acyl dehydratase
LNARFKKPIHVGEEITFLVENKEKIVVKNSKNEICVDVSKSNV